MTGSSGPSTTVQSEVDELLGRLHELVERIRQARATIAPLEAALAIARREFEEWVGPLRREALRLEHEIKVLKMPGEPAAHQPLVTTWGAKESGQAQGRRREAPQDADAFEKDILLEHLVWVLDADLDKRASELLGTVQGLVNDPSTDLADVLEELPWGPAWTSRSQNENLAAQRHRLAEWERALHRQLESLERVHERLRDQDPRYRLYEEQRDSPKAWKAYLEQSAARQREQNEELRAELKELLDMRQKREDHDER